MTKGRGKIRGAWHRLEDGLGRGAARAVAGTVVGVMVAGTAWWWSHPGVLHDGIGATMGPRVAVGEPVYVGIGYPRPGTAGTVRLRDLEARVRVNSARARISYVACHREPERGVSAIGSMSGDGALREACLETRRAEGADISLGSPLSWQALLVVEPTRPGRVVVDGVEMGYRYGWRPGSVVSGPRVRLRTP